MTMPGLPKEIWFIALDYITDIDTFGILPKVCRLFATYFEERDHLHISSNGWAVVADTTRKEWIGSASIDKISVGVAAIRFTINTKDLDGFRKYKIIARINECILIDAFVGREETKYRTLRDAVLAMDLNRHIKQALYDRLNRYVEAYRKNEEYSYSIKID